MSEDSDTDNEFHSPGSNHSTHGPEEEHEEDLSFRENEDLYYGLPHSHPANPNEDGTQARVRPRVLSRPYVFSEDPVFTWPPRHLSSEDYTHLEDTELAHPPSLPAITQEQDNSDHRSDQVFDQVDSVSETGTVIMAPTLQDQFKDLRAKFKRVQRNWASNYNRHVACTETILEQDVEVMASKRDDAENLAEDLYDLMEQFTDSDSTRHVMKEITDGIDQIHRQMSLLYQSYNEGNPRADATPAAVDTNKNIDTEVIKLSSVVQHHDQELDSLLVKFDELLALAPGEEASNKTADKVKGLLTSSKDNVKSAEECYKKLVSEISVYTDEVKKNTQKQASEKLWKTLKKKSDSLQSKVEDFLEKVPKPTSSKPSIPLERLPLPKYSGNKTEYHQFKINFEKHVKYDDEDERVLALKQRCLSKEADRVRVANCQTLSDCWEQLDGEHGSVETTVCDILNTWNNLKPPTTDVQFVNFVEKIQAGVNCLESLQSMHELSSSAIREIVKKLNKEMRNEVSKLITSNTDTSRKTQTIVLEFLAQEKKSAQWRNSNAPKTSPAADNDTTASGFTASGRGGRRGGGRGGGSGRGGSAGAGGGDKGRGGGGQGRGGQGHRGARGQINTQCLLCEENHALSSCPRWMDQHTDKRFLLNFCYCNKICTRCLKQGHNFHKCPVQEPDLCPCGSSYNVYICCNTEDCRRRKNWDTTNSGNNSISANNVMVNGAKIGQAILPIQQVQVHGSPSRNVVKIVTMFDNCSQNSFINEKAAKKLQLKGDKISFILITTDGNRSRMYGTLYELEIVDIHGEVHQIQVIGLKELSTRYSGFKILNINKAISKIEACRGLTEDKLTRMGSEIDVLIGSDLASLHPQSVTNIGDLVILKSQFGTGWCVMGHSVDHVRFTSNDMGTRANFVGVEDINYGPSLQSDPETMCHVAGTTRDQQFLELISTESIGVNVTTKCKSCKIKSDSCKECKLILKTSSYLEYLQDQQIEESIEKIPDAPGYICSYPYNSELEYLQSNEKIAFKRAENVENSLKRKPEDMKQINDVLEQGFENGTFRWLTDKEINEWDGHVHYLPLNVTYKDSASTPCRICFDSSQPDKNGRSLNCVMGKGKNPINNFASVILKFRSAEKVASGDIKKMFNQISVRSQDMHLRRFFLRPDGFGGNQEWRVAVPTCVNFGETAAPAVATMVKNRAATDFKHISPSVSNMIIHNCIMDDINIDCKYTEDIDVNIQKAEQILGHGKFSFKQWVKSGDRKEKQLEKDGVTKSLGLYWRTEQDLLVYRIKLNFSKKKRNRYLAPDTTSDTLEQDFPTDMTKRLALKLNHTIFDPANILQPWMLKPRLAYREILFHEKENNYSDWDQPLPNKFREQWLQLTKEMFELESLSFTRSMVPIGYNPNVKPLLCMFSDGSDLGQCAVAYLVWTMMDGSSSVSLVTSRTKIASLTKVTTPRMELCAAQLQTRLAAWLQEELDLEIAKVLHIVDASIVLGMIRNVSLKFDTYTAPRVTEIQASSDIDQWYWVETTSNSSDLGTRGHCSIEDLGPGSMWREGPAWLKNPRDSWPLRSDFRKQVPGLKKEFEILPDTVNNLTQLVQLSSELSSTDPPHCEHTVIVHNTDVTPSQQGGNVNMDPDLASADQPSFLSSVTNIVDHTRYNCWFKLVRVTARILKLLYIKNGLPVPDQVDLLKQARRSWLLSMMSETKEMLKKMKLSGFLVHEKDGIVYATTRSKQEILNPDDLIILSPTHPVTKKILFSFHNISHKGVQHTVARSRIYFWIPQASKIVKSLKKQCFACRRMDAEAMQQLMAPLPQIRLKSSPVWHHSMLDLFGPIEISQFINVRTSRKTWVVIITCLTTRACWCYLAEDYSTDHLLSVLRKHEARNGSPAQYFADLGRQIVGADRVIAEAMTNIDQQQVETFAANRNVKFTFGTPHFPEGQGACERLIQEVKKALKVITKHKLSFGELDCLLSEASYIVNSRPLQPNPTAGDDGFLCPNDVMFGRSDMSPPDIDIADGSLTRKAAQKQRIMSEFWDKWSTSYHQTLVKYHKWLLKHRNARSGDIVMILDKEVSKGRFCIGIIDRVKIDDDQVIRKVIVKYKVRAKTTDDPLELRPSKYKYQERNVRGLALLVKAEEIDNYENINVDELRLQDRPDEHDNSDHDGNDGRADEQDNIEEEGNEDRDDDHEDNEGHEGTDDHDEEDNNSNSEVKIDDQDQEENERALPPTSSGRKRQIPKKFL